MVKKVAIVALDPRASAFYGRQVQELFGDVVKVNSYSVREGTVSNMERSDLYLMSTDAFENREDVPQYIPIDAQISEIHVTYMWETIKELREIPAGTTALFVNMTEKMVREATATLNQLGVNHVKFIPFYPGAEPVEGIELAVTPDEERYVPDNVKRVMNIGHRCLTSETMIEAALKLGMEELLETPRFQEYFENVVTNKYNFDMMFARSRRLESQFDILMEILDEGIIGINERAEVFAVNQKAEDITGLKRELVLHKQASATLSNLPLLECLKTKEKVEARVIRINGVNVGVTVVPVLRKEDCIGAFAILQRFNDAENRQHELRNQLLNKGNRAKYSFEDVIGVSEGVERTKQILKRMAYTESPVLLIGETGTGKELFANAVHQASRRAKGPFVAINCGAMPENLLESELFGYEEGAFTGAKKGGRPGLFEFAHGGTLFLDEVEGMSPALQVKLLRVLQEHEIMRVGGNKIISVDVRIVAATNESLEEKVQEGSFRRDLYYRLNTLPVLIPPLRQRGDDVFLLLERFAGELKGEFALSGEVREIFRRYAWPGNIRELRNLAEYFCFTGSPVITVEDLPPTFMYEKNIQGWEGTAQAPVSEGAQAPDLRQAGAPDEFEAASPWQQAMEKRGIEAEEYWFVLETLYQAYGERQPAGRDGILEKARAEKVYLSQIGVRNIMGILKEYGLVKVGRGRHGSRITSLGRKIWEDRSK
ncbi:MAG: sigma 54-interacting transcriptional regulator [Clostridium sp.]|nr:sigma 54-interacting transcriptional regulator [Clostridium sp.]